MSGVTLGQQRLRELVKGHPLAASGLREYQVAVDTLRTISQINPNDTSSMCYVVKIATEALEKGGFLDHRD